VNCRANNGEWITSTETRTAAKQVRITGTSFPDTKLRARAVLEVDDPRGA